MVPSLIPTHSLLSLPVLELHLDHSHKFTINITFQMVFNQILLLIGSGLFLNSAYSVYAERILLHGGTTLNYIPSIKLIFQLSISFLLLSIGTILSVPPLQDIHWKTQLKKKSIDEFDSKLGFINLHNRASVLLENS
ncbi:hypothetical protein DFH28DRAFT_959236 [Melampsora americana]|nr:hypothetical protein DFH28DRAFT_959236 [Melampsora americana]